MCASSIKVYTMLRKVLFDFSTKKNFPLRICSVSNLKKRELQAEKKYWIRFYLEFTDYLFDDLDCYDNYVGTSIKRLRTFFNYLNDEKDMSIGSFHKKFYIHSEQIEIITLSAEQVKYLIDHKEFEASLPEYLQKTKDMFVFGCTVALRGNDIFKLTQSNLERTNDTLYLKVHSQKTNTLTRVALPDYAIDIINKYPKDSKTLFPVISNGRFNINIKELIERTNWTDIRTKTRQKRGRSMVVYKNKKTMEPYRFCDLMTSHTMRRTAITTLLCEKMSENAVRKISGHAPGSKEFFRYVELSQQFVDDESKKAYERIRGKSLD